jgi:four helix bundle protein
MKDFRSLQVWEKAHQLALAVYKATVTFPASELYGLTSQLRRSGASIPTNLAEGCGRDGDAEFARFTQIAMGSASELEYLLLLSKDLRLLQEVDYERLSAATQEVKKMLASLIGTLRGERS